MCTLLTSVFGPFAQDDEFGNRAINPILYTTLLTASSVASIRMM
jgi:hypothetical protein